MVDIAAEFIAAGGNRHPSTADWDASSRLLAFGASNNIAIWDPLDEAHHGIQTLLPGHTDTVNAVKFLTSANSKPICVSGSADKSLRIWTSDPDSPNGFKQLQVLNDHQASINCISSLPGSNTFVTGAADATVKVWRTIFDEKGDFSTVELIQSISLSPRYFPLSVAISQLDNTEILAVAGTNASIQIYVSRHGQFALAATLTGHEAWIRSLEFTKESSAPNSDVLLASASQDKYIRLWRVHQGEDLPTNTNAANDPSLGILGKSLSNKAHRFQSELSKYSITFEALLLGHEDWIYTVRWHLDNTGLKLLSASADNSLAMWEPDESSGIWVCMTRLGEISSQKGSTSATGSTGGFWVGLWSKDGGAVVSLGRTGSWRLWKHDQAKDIWIQDVAITGHTKEVKCVCWSADSSYILSTSSDQTTRLFAEWHAESSDSWHEFSRSQIHGYDLNCVSSLTPTRFVSGADEKLLRVFDEPSAVASLLSRLCRIESLNSNLPDAANIPVLGLSNKAIQAVEDDKEAVDGDEDEKGPLDPASVVHKSTLNIDHPPYEDHLARHFLWPETEKLYGHGYEISALATSHNGRIVATACKASSIDHAVIRLYETAEWREIKPPLAAHTLTITNLAFSDDDKYLLSVGRDRQWALFAQSGQPANDYKLVTSNPKGHTRMILDGAWAPGSDSRVFATAGRDKSVKIWAFDGETAEVKSTCAATAAVTAISFVPSVIDGSYVIAFGTDDGTVTICRISVADLAITSSRNLERSISPTKTINKLSWRTTVPGYFHLIVASDDASIRLYKVSGVT